MKREDLALVLQIVLAGLLVAIVVLLINLQSEISGIRSEQVKNRYYSLPVEASKRLNASENAEQRKRRLESSVGIQGEVEVTGSVEIEQITPLQVEIAP